MRLYIIRHGETDLNRKRLLQGRYDSKLNAEGKKQAAACGEWVKEQGVSFDKVYVSPLDRAQETAEIITGFSRAQMIQDPRIIEIAFGPYEMSPYEELDASMKRYFSDPEHEAAPKGMETVEEVMDRVAHFLTDLRQAAQKGERGNIAIVTHGITIRTIMAQLKGISFAKGWQLMVHNCDVFFAEWKAGDFTEPIKLRGEESGKGSLGRETTGAEKKTAVTETGQPEQPPAIKKEYRTRNKDRIMDYLMRHKEKRFHAGDVYEEMCKQGMSMNLTTVYRNLEKLTQNGTLIKYKTSDEESALYQYSESEQCKEHLHLQCRRCKQIYHLDCGFMDQISEHLMMDHHFLLECDGSLLIGLCENCREATNTQQ